MPKWRPLELPRDVPAINCSLVGIRMKERIMGVDIKIGSEGILRVSFADVIVNRIMDNAPLIDPEEDEHVGMSPDHVAYELKGSWFLESHPQVGDGARHFRILLPTGSVDVISRREPRLTILDLVSSSD